MIIRITEGRVYTGWCQKFELLLATGYEGCIMETQEKEHDF